MDLQLRNKIIVITGGAAGIGEAITRSASAEGAIPIIVDRSGDAAQKLASELKATAIVADLTSTEACQRAVAETVAQYGRIDALVNNAGVNDKVGLESGSPAEFVASLERNLLHVYNMAHFAAPHLKAARGSIVNIASKVAVTGQGGTSGYAAAKGGILALTREWAVDLFQHDVRVNAILPAEVMTPLYRSWLAGFPNPEEKMAHTLSRIPLGHRMTEPEEIAAMAIFLISGRAKHITGQYLYVDGGYVHLDRAVT